MENKLRFILGASGSGKSEVLFRELTERSVANPDKNYIIVVPEQFTLETQKKVVTMHSCGAAANIDIVSFNRLSFRVFEELGISNLEILDDTGKSLILRKVIANESGKLNIYREKIHLHGFVEEMKSVISELYLYGIGPEKYREIREQVKANKLIAEKLKDIEVIYEGFQKYIQDKYITKEELLDKLCQVVPDSRIIRESELYFDGFTGFTPVQNKLISLFLQYSKGLTITVTVGRESLEEIKSGIGKGSIAVSEQELFKMSKDTINTILGLYVENFGKEGLEGVVKNSVFLGEASGGRWKGNPVLEHLEQNLFRGNGKRLENDGSLQVMRFDNPRSEVEYMTDYLAYQVRNNGKRYRDFAIISGDMEGYGRILADNLMIRDIPFFMDNKRSLILNPAVTFIRAILEVIDTDFSYESVFKFLKSGIEVLDMDSVDILENYVIACGIRGHKKYFTPFMAKKRRMTDEEYTGINEIRERFTEITGDIYEEFKGKKLEEGEKLNVRKMTEYLYEFMVRFQLESTLKEMEEAFTDMGEMSLGKEYGQTYAYIIDLFDKIVSLLGEEVISLKEYREILDAGFEEIKVGVIPLGADQVIVGDIERTRLKDIQILMVLGANDGVIPRHSKKNSLLSQSDRNYLKKLDIELSPTVRENIFIQKFYLYLNLTKPSRELLLSYADSGMDGAALRPSYLIGEIERLYDRTDRCEEAGFADCLKLSSKAFALKYLSENLNKNNAGDMSDFLKELYSYFYQDKDYSRVLAKVREGIFFDNNPTKLSRSVAEQLAGKDTLRSVSRLEKYAACAYAHFLSYGLQLAEREKYEVSMADMGTLYHRCMELFSGEMVRQGYDFRTISREERNHLVDSCVEKITENYGNTVLKSTKRNEYLIRKIKSVCKKTVWAMCEHVKRGKFQPENFEFVIKEGRIDRLDTYEEDGRLYIKIIDYKSGNKKFDMSDVFNGLQLQLVYYMGEALKIKESLARGREVIPAGTFYFQIKSPYIECNEKMEDEKLQEILLKEYKMTGLVNDMREPAIAMDHILEEEKAESDIIPLKSKELGSAATASGLNEVNFQKMIVKVEKIMDDFTEEILDGRIDKNPYKKANISPCNYCSYKSICNFDDREFNNSYRKLLKISKAEDVVKELNGEEESDELDRRTE